MRSVTLRKLKIGSGLPKIIVPVTGRTHEGITAEAQRVAALVPDAIEWRADCYAAIHDTSAVVHTLEGIRRAIGDMPLVFTCRTLTEGGNTSISPDEYAGLNIAVARSHLADGLDIELLSHREYASALLEAIHGAGLLCIGSCHMARTPGTEEMAAMLLEMCRMGSDIQKLAVYAHTAEDGLKLLRAAQSALKQGAGPLIPIAMGEQGMVSRVAGENFSAAAVFAAAENSSAPGQLSLGATRALMRAVHSIME